MSSEAVGWVYRHSPYTGVTFQVHAAVADSVNDQHGNEFWLAKPKLALKARTSVASTKRAMETLVADGYLDLLEESGGRKPTRYLFLFPEHAPLIYDTRSTGSPRTGSPETANRLTSDAQPVHQKQPTGSPASKNAPHKEGSQVDPKRNPREPNLKSEFDEFWSAYPRHEEKGEARRAWSLAVTKADPAVIIAGANRYRCDRNRQAEFTPYPAKWLRAERWEDDPLPARTSIYAQRPTYQAPPIDDDRSGRSRVLTSEDL